MVLTLGMNLEMPIDMIGRTAMLQSIPCLSHPWEFRMQARKGSKGRSAREVVICTQLWHLGMTACWLFHEGFEYCISR